MPTVQFLRIKRNPLAAVNMPMDTIVVLIMARGAFMAEVTAVNELMLIQQVGPCQSLKDLIYWPESFRN